MASLPNNISLKIEIWKGWFTADTDSKVYNVSRVGPLSERNRKWIERRVNLYKRDNHVTENKLIKWEKQ